MGRSRNKKLTREQKLWRAVIILALAVVILVFRLTEDTGVDRQPGDRFVVTRIIDGDSVELAGGDKVRLLAIDTPEKGEPLYDEAKQLLSELTLGKSTRLEYAGRRRDKYGRLLAYMYVDTVLVNKAILDNGLGYLYLFKDTDIGQPHTKILLEAQKRAIERHVGIFGLPREAEDFYLNSVGSFRFHRPSCRLLSDFDPNRHRRIATREEALREGLSPCRTCGP